MVKKFKSKVIGICFLIILATAPIFAQNLPLTHTMTDEERSLMPYYLQTESKRGLTPPPMVPVRNIAEFESMEGVLIAYPLGIPVSLVKEMAENTTVTTIVSSSSQESSARSTYSSGGVNLGNCEFVIAAHDSYWTRDYGPWYTADANGTVAIVDFTYNRPRPNDNNVPSEMAAYLNIGITKMDLRQAGGNYMTDGHGISAATDLVWEENTQYTQTQINDIMNSYLGITTYHVTRDPLNDYIKHIDCWGKFLDVDKIMIGRVPASNPNYTDYEAVADYFASQTTSYGNKYQVYRVDAPDGQPYTNSLILNKKVLVPITGSAWDDDAIASYQQAMPGYEVLGFTGSWQKTDALHCRTKGIADRNMVYIDHMPLFGEQSATRGVTITADIIPYSGAPVDPATVKITYRVNNGAYASVTMTNTGGRTYSGTLPTLPTGSSVGYYIEAGDTNGNYNSHPYIGAPDPHVFTAIGVTPRNLALENYQVFASGEYAAEFGKNYAVDGNEATLWGSKPGDGLHYYVIDLNNVNYTKLTELVLKFSAPYYPKKFQFAVSNTFSGNLADWVVSPNITCTGDQYSLPVADLNLHYRYIALLAYKANLNSIALGLKEFEVWGE